MTVHFLVGLAQNHKTLEVILALLVSFISIGITFSLGMRLLEAKIIPIKVFLASVVLVFFLIIIRSMVPLVPSLIIYILAMTFFMSVLSHKKIIKPFGCSCLLMVFNSIGALIVGNIGMIDRPFADFLTETPIGMIVGILSEALLPIIILACRKEPFFTAEWKDKGMLKQVLIYFCGFIVLIVSTVNFYTNKLQLIDYIAVVAAAVIIFFMYFNHTSNLKKEIKNINDRVEAQADAIQDEIKNLKINAQNQSRRKYDKLPPELKSEIENVLYQGEVYSYKLSNIQSELANLYRN
jgi:cell division protein FtsL